jgi:hypothetical protein
MVLGGYKGIHTSFMILVLWTNDDIAEVRLLLVSSCKPSRWKRASAFFFHLVAFPASTAKPTFLPPKVTFLGPLAGVVVGMASLAEASAILLVFGAEVEKAVWQMRASGVGRIIAGDGFAFEGAFWPITFLLLCIKSRLEQVKVKMEET